MEEVLNVIIKNLVDEPDKVVITRKEDENGIKTYYVFLRMDGTSYML